MTNRIRRLEILDHSLSPAEAILRIEAAPEQITPATELRGRLMGPRCPYATTVEVAYAVRPQPGTAAPATLLARVVIPEPSLWEPVSPFLYAGVVELWQDGQQCEQKPVSHGLRQVQLGGHGLRVNGRPLALRGREVQHCTEADALAMRRQGINLWVVTADECAAPLCELADHLGFFILGDVASTCEPQLIRQLDRHASCLGWLVPPETESLRGCRGLLGVRAPQPLASLPEGAHFLACPVNQATGQTQARVPVLLFGSESTAASENGELVMGVVKHG